MKRKVDLPNQSFDITMIGTSATAPARERQNINILDQLPQIIDDKTTRNLHNSKCTVTWLSNMAHTQDIRVQLLKFLTQLIRWGWLKVWWKWIAIGHR